MKPLFDHEKLDVYQEAIAFCGWVGEFLETVSGKTAAKDQLDRASTSCAPSGPSTSTVAAYAPSASRSIRTWRTRPPSLGPAPRRTDRSSAGQIACPGAWRPARTPLCSCGVTFESWPCIGGPGSPARYLLWR